MDKLSSDAHVRSVILVTVWKNFKSFFVAKAEQTGQLRILRSQLPTILRRLAKIPDPRNPKKIKHKLTVLMIYGILMFVFQMTSRHEANREMTHCFPWPWHRTLIRVQANHEVKKLGEGSERNGLVVSSSWRKAWRVDWWWSPGANSEA